MAHTMVAFPSATELVKSVKLLVVLTKFVDGVVEDFKIVNSEYSSYTHGQTDGKCEHQAPSLLGWHVQMT